MDRQYPSDVTDRQWRVLRKLLTSTCRRGRPPLDRRWVLNAILYVLRTGCQWRQLPRDFPHWKSVSTVFWRWRQAGVWKLIHDALRDRCRRAAGKRRLSRVAIVDSQSVRTAEGGEFRGYDAGKKITGRKRHLAVDTLGLLWSVVVHGADLQDHDGAAFVIARLQEACTRLQVIFADAAYARAGLPDLLRLDAAIRLDAANGPASGAGLRVRGAAEAVDRGTDLRLAQPLPPSQQGLRT